MNGESANVKMKFCKKKVGCCILGVMAGWLLIFPAGQIVKAQDRSSQIEEIKKKAKDINRKIEQRKAKIQKFTRKESDIIYKLNRADRELNQSRKRVAALAREISILEKKITKATRASEDLMQRIKANEKYVASRMVALYKLNWLGKFHVLASAESLHELLQRKTAIERILIYDQKVIKELMDSQLDLKSVQSQLEAQRDTKRRRAAEYQKRINRMAIERRKRSNLLAYVRKEKSAQLAAIESLKQAAQDLDEKMKNLSTGPTAKTSEEFTAREPFREYKGLLKMPVKGKIVSLFGKFKNTQYKVLNFRSGIEIQTERGEPIQAVFAGKILYADWFKGYGNMIIIDHGENYYTVYAHIEETFKSAGDVVEAGEVMATVGDTGSITGPKLYFEVRHHGKPLDPMQWLEKS
ncbi:MAG: peptidoglycan DD-metalloendopeptidase family protein [Desulfobacterales bacterium]|jgi:septal ring factor EnvC (AmiA/AmiB activator)